MAELREDTPGGGHEIVPDQNPAGQDAQRALDHAHMIIQNEMGNFGLVQQGPDEGNQDHVIGAGIAVDGDHVEGPLHGQGQSLLQSLRPDGGIGIDESQHGGHVGVNHSGTLGHAADNHIDGPDRDRHGNLLGDRIGGHDGSRSLSSTVYRELRRGLGQSGFHLLQRQGNPDDTR